MIRHHSHSLTQLRLNFSRLHRRRWRCRCEVVGVKPRAPSLLSKKDFGEVAKHALGTRGDGLRKCGGEERERARRMKNETLLTFKKRGPPPTAPTRRRLRRGRPSHFKPPPPPPWGQSRPSSSQTVAAVAFASGPDDRPTDRDRSRLVFARPGHTAAKSLDRDRVMTMGSGASRLLGQYSS